MNGNRIEALDWLKAAGITIIVWGHVIGLTALNIVSPIYIKQFGVAFFVFVTGYTASRDRRPWPDLVLRRLFDPWLFGIATAILMSAIALVRIHTTQKSNYIPFVGGVNVFLDYFPANPTTWFLGCYLHILLAAAWLRRLQWRAWHLVAIAAAEIAVRAILIVTTGRLFMAYMLLSNWITCLALGFAVARSAWRPSRVLLAGVAGVALAFALRPVGHAGFPFILAERPGWTEVVRTSAAVTLLYVPMTAAVYAAAILVRWRPRLVTLIADHTLLIFLLHMPLYYVIPAALTGHPRTFAHGLACFLICMTVPLAISIAVHRVFDPHKLRRRVEGLREVAAQ